MNKKQKPFLMCPPRILYTAYLALGRKAPKWVMKKEIDYLECELNRLRENKWVKRLVKWRIIKP